MDQPPHQQHNNDTLFNTEYIQNFSAGYHSPMPRRAAPATLALITSPQSPPRPPHSISRAFQQVMTTTPQNYSSVQAVSPNRSVQRAFGNNSAFKSPEVKNFNYPGKILEFYGAGGGSNQHHNQTHAQNDQNGLHNVEQQQHPISLIYAQQHHNQNLFGGGHPQHVTSHFDLRVPQAVAHPGVFNTPRRMYPQEPLFDGSYNTPQHHLQQYAQQTQRNSSSHKKNLPMRHPNPPSPDSVHMQPHEQHSTPPKEGALGGAPPNATPPKKTKTCNCKKTKCLKLYCDCFSIGELCGPECNCFECCNTNTYRDYRHDAINQILEKNQEAFSSKIQSDKRNRKLVHKKGCNCRKSNCLKKYCECYQAGINCSDQCKCDECKNCDKPFLKKKLFASVQKMPYLQSGTKEIAINATALPTIIQQGGGSDLQEQYYQQPAAIQTLQYQKSNNAMIEEGLPNQQSDTLLKTPQHTATSKFQPIIAKATQHPQTPANTGTVQEIMQQQSATTAAISAEKETAEVSALAAKKRSFVKRNLNKNSALEREDSSDAKQASTVANCGGNASPPPAQQLSSSSSQLMTPPMQSGGAVVNTANLVGAKVVQTNYIVAPTLQLDQSVA